MASSLYEISVASYLQNLDALGGVLDKGLGHCTENAIKPEEIVESRLFADMMPFRFQVQQTVAHSLGAIEALKGGHFAPGMRGKTDDSYAALQALVAGARDALRKLTPEEVNARAGADVTFTAGEFKMVFRAEEFILSFSLPNFYFHATTAYDLLRMRGVAVGKRDYLGMPRLKSGV